MWLEAQGVLEADRQAILEEAERWTLKEGGWQGTAEVRKGPHTCKHCSDGAKIIMRTWPNSKWDWMCRCCGREVKGK
jgi:hypothetical protein